MDALDYDRAKVRRIDLYGAVKRDPGPPFVELSQQRPFYIEVDGAPQAVITRYADVKTALEDHGRFSSKKRPWAGTKGFYYFNSLPVVTDNDPPQHTNLRRLMAPAFFPRKLIGVEEGVTAFVDRKLNEIQAKGGTFDVVSDFAQPLSAYTLFSLLFNMPEEDWVIFTHLSDTQKAAFSTLSPGPEYRQAYDDAWAAALAYCERLIKKRRAAPGDDLATAIIQAHDVAGRISAQELFATLMVLYAAGIGGIINYTGWTLYRLGRHPDQMQKLRRSPDLINGAIDESLRTDPSVYVALRYATADFEFEGLQLYEGMPLHVFTSCPAYDPAIFPDPLRFDITRKQDIRELMAFGHGVHHCIGAALARMTARVSVGEAVRRLPDLRLADPNEKPEIVGVPKERGPKSIRMQIHG